MVFISEFLPNPKGSDTAGEWIELKNDGTAPVSLAGWRLENKSAKKYVLQQTIPAQGFLLLPRSRTKLVLKNSNEAVSLFDAGGTRRDQIAFSGSMPEGKSVGRFDGRVTLLNPTPGTENTGTALVYPKLNYPLDQPLHHPWGIWSLVGAALGCALFLTGVAVYLYIYTHDEKDLIVKSN